MQQRRTFSEESKREAVKLVRQPGASKAGIARDLGVGANLLERRGREQEGQSVPALTSSGELMHRIRKGHSVLPANIKDAGTPVI